MSDAAAAPTPADAAASKPQPLQVSAECATPLPEGVSLAPLLMFTGRCEEALRFYIGLLPGSRVVSIERHGAADPAGNAEGSIKLAKVIIAGQTVHAIDSPPVHAFGFTPSISLSVQCSTRAQIDAWSAALQEGGQAMMPLGEYGFCTAFAWVTDRFGVSWQLTLP